MRFFLAVCLIMTLSFTTNVYALTNADNTIGSYYIPGLVINKKEGLFVNLHNEIINRTQLKLDLIIEPTKRVQQSFKSSQLIGYFPELWQHIPKNRSEVIVSDNIWLKSIIVFTLINEKPLTKLSELEGLTIGAVRGFSYGQVEENKKINIQYVSSDEQNIEKLLSGRIDAIIGDNASTVNVIEHSKNSKSIFYDLEQPIDILDVFYVFQNTPQGHIIRDKVNSAIQSLKREGLLKLNTKTGKSEILLSR